MIKVILVFDCNGIDREKLREIFSELKKKKWKRLFKKDDQFKRRSYLPENVWYHELPDSNPINVLTEFFNEVRDMFDEKDIFSPIFVFIASEIITDWRIVKGIDE